MAAGSRPSALTTPGWPIPLCNLANLKLYQGRFAEAEPLDRRALAIREKALGPDHPDVAVTLEGMAGVSPGEGRGEEAVALLQRTLAIREKAFPPDHPFLADTRADLARALRGLGRDAEAAAVEAGGATPTPGPAGPAVED
jgi:eukaryotic-like serine/threonine-protein kinase